MGQGQPRAEVDWIGAEIAALDDGSVGLQVPQDKVEELAKEARALCDVRMKSGSAEVKARLFAECIALDVWCEVCEGVEQGGEAMARIKLDVMRAKRWDMGNEFVDKCFEQVQAL